MLHLANFSLSYSSLNLDIICSKKSSLTYHVQIRCLFPTSLASCPSLVLQHISGRLFKTFLVRLVCFLLCSASCQTEETQRFLDWIYSVGVPWSTVLGTAGCTRKSRYNVLLLSQKLSCGETAVITPADILRRLNHGSWNTFPFPFVFYMNGRERCFHTYTWETERAKLNKCDSVKIHLSSCIANKTY